MLTIFLFVNISFLYATTNRYAQTQPRTVAGGLRPHPSKTGLRPEPDLEQLEGAKQIDSFGYLDCGGYGRIFVLVISEERQAFFILEFDTTSL